MPRVQGLVDDHRRTLTIEEVTPSCGESPENFREERKEDHTGLEPTYLWSSYMRQSMSLVFKSLSRALLQLVVERNVPGLSQNLNTAA